MKGETPDFRKMTLEDIRESIGLLNKMIAQLRAVRDGEKRKFALDWGIGTASAVAMTTIFPPAGMFMATFTMLATMDSAVNAQIAGDMERQAVKLRSRFKAVYRARPGRKQFDLAARRDREKARKSTQGVRKFFPKFPSG